MYPTPSRGRFRQEEEKEGRVKGRERNNLAVEVTDGEVSTEGSIVPGSLLVSFFGMDNLYPPSLHSKIYYS